VARLPIALINTFQSLRAGTLSAFLVLGLVLFMVAVVAAIIFMERGQRRIQVQYAKRVVGRRIYGGQSTHLPLKVNSAGVIPPIFASSIIMFPATIANFISTPWVQTINSYFLPGTMLYNIFYVVFIFFFCYFYTAVTFNPVDVADNMRKYGGYIPGRRPGRNTAEFIDRVLTRITFGGATYLAVICVLPTIMITHFGVPFYFGGTGLLIVVGVALDTVQQIEAHLLTRYYEGFMRRGRIKGRRG